MNSVKHEGSADKQLAIPAQCASENDHAAELPRISSSAVLLSYKKHQNSVEIGRKMEGNFRGKML